MFTVITDNTPTDSISVRSLANLELHGTWSGVQVDLQTLTSAGTWEIVETWDADMVNKKLEPGATRLYRYQATGPCNINAAIVNKFGQDE
jgi:hypothetical protein